MRTVIVQIPTEQDLFWFTLVRILVVVGNVDIILYDILFTWDGTCLVRCRCSRIFEGFLVMAFTFFPFLAFRFFLLPTDCLSNIDKTCLLDWRITWIVSCYHRSQCFCLVALDLYFVRHPFAFAGLVWGYPVAMLLIKPCELWVIRDPYTPRYYPIFYIWVRFIDYWVTKSGTSLRLALNLVI